MPRNTLLIVIFMFIPSAFLSSTQAQQIEETPYLFYFDYEAKHFIVQQADGDDSRVLGAGLMSEQYPGGPGFSHSGDWFAWYGWNTTFEAPPDPHSVYIVRTDGSEAWRYDESFSGVNLAWHPEQNWLLIAGETFTENQMIIRLIDVETDEILSEGEAPSALDSCRFPQLHWASDNAHALIDCTARQRDSQQAYIAVLSPDGQFRWVTLNGHPLSAVTAEGWTATWQTGTLTTVNVLTDEQTVIETGLELENPPLINWRASGEALLIDEAHPTHADGQGNVYWLSDNTLTLLQAEADFSSPWSGDNRYALVDGLLFDGETLTPLSPEISNLYTWLDTDHALVSTADGKAILDVRDQSLLPVSANAQNNAALSPDGTRLAYILDGPIIETLTNNSQLYIPPHTKAHASAGGGEVTWGPSSGWLLIQDNALVGNAPAIRHTSIVRADGTQLRELSFCVATPVCTGWLPPQVNPAVIPEIDQVIIEKPEPLIVLEGTAWPEIIHWSDNNTLVVRYTAWDGVIYDLNTLKIISTTIPEDIPGYDEEPEFWNDMIVITQGTNGEWVLIPDGSVYDTETEELITTITPVYSPYILHSTDGWLLFDRDGRQEIILWHTVNWQSYELPFIATEAAFSPDGEMLAISQSWHIHIYAMDDLIQHFVD